MFGGSCGIGKVIVVGFFVCGVSVIFIGSFVEIVVVVV